MHLTYHVSDFLPECRAQALGNADRPLCALMAATASFVRGNDLGGLGKGMEPDQIDAALSDYLRRSGAPAERAELWLRGINGEKYGHAVMPNVLDDALDAYQINTLANLPCSGGIANVDMGLGKTIMGVSMAIGAAWNKRCAPTRCWIVCPLNAMGAWEPYLEELQKHYQDVKVLSVDSAHKFTAIPPIGGFLIIDEAHACKSGDSRRTKAMMQVRGQFDICFVATGTFLHAGIEACLALADLATPGMSAFSNKWACGEYFHCLVKKDIGGRSVAELEKPVGENLERFLAWIDRFTVSLMTDSKEVQDSGLVLPPQEIEDVGVNQPWPPLDEVAANLALTMMAESPDGTLPHASAVMHALLRGDMEAKWDAWVQAANDANALAEPWVFFAHYRETLDWLQAKMEEHQIPFVRVDGDVNVKDRQEAQRRFQAGEVGCFLGQTRAAGVSINLFRSAHSAMWDATTSAIDYAQALRRTRRRGQTRDCLHLDLMSNKLQQIAFKRLRDGKDFNARHAAWQETKTKLAATGRLKEDT